MGLPSYRSGCVDEGGLLCVLWFFQFKTKMGLGMELAMGLKKGHRVQKTEFKPRHRARKGKITVANKMIRELIREICGFAPYERRCMEFLKISREKRALRFLKRRLGTHVRAMRKREELGQIISAQRR